LPVDNSTDTFSGVPVDLIGLWNLWSVKDEIAVDVELNVAAIQKVNGIFLGFGSGDRKKWAALLQDARNIEYLVSWTGNNGQHFFDAVCNMTWLKRLCFGRLSAPDISNISRLTELEYLCATQLTRSRSLEPIVAMKRLRVVELGLTKRVDNYFECFESNKMHSVESMKFYSQSIISVPSFRPFSKIPSLEYLSLPTIRPADRSLKWLYELPRLKFVHIPKGGWDDKEISALEEAGVDILVAGNSQSR